MFIATKFKTGGFLKDNISLLIRPVSMVTQLAGFPAVFFYDFVGPYPAILRLFIFWYGIGVIPKIQAVQILKIKPQADMMWMIVSFTRLWCKRKASGYSCAIC